MDKSWRIFIPSHRRGGKSETLKLLRNVRSEYVTLVVSEDDLDAYRKSYFDVEVVAHPKELNGRIAKVRNWMLKEAEKRGLDYLVTLDDDIYIIGYWEGTGRFFVKDEEVIKKIEEWLQIMDEWGLLLGGLNFTDQPNAYKKYAPISLNKVVVATFSMIKLNTGIYYDERFGYKEDYDYFLQHYQKRKAVLRLEKYFFKAKHITKEGGLTGYRTMERELFEMKEMQRKWGSKIVRVDWEKAKKGKTNVKIVL